VRRYIDTFGSTIEHYRAFGDTRLYFAARGDGQPHPPIDTNKNIAN
jgi:hypothetical protein